MTQTTKALVFDLDGTLADTPALITELITGVMAEFDRYPTPEAVHATVGRPLEASLASLLGTTVQDPRADAAVLRYRERYEKEVLTWGPQLLFPGVPEGLARLREAGYPLGIATSKILRSARSLLEVTGIRDCFDVLACHDLVSRGKPDPEMGQLALRVLGASAERSWYVGDTSTDMQMAVAAGMRALGVSYGVDDARQLIAGGAEQVVSSFDEVVEVLLDEH